MGVGEQVVEEDGLGGKDGGFWVPEIQGHG